MSELEFSCVSGVGMMTKDPFVAVEFGETKTQMTTAKAREIAMILLECAESAESDRAVMDYFANKVGLPFEQAAIMVQELRNHRKDMEEL